MWENDAAPPKYKEGYLQKKEGDKKWEEYWVVLRGIYLIFYIHKSSLGEIVDKFCGCITLNFEAKCMAAKRKNYSFPFYLVTNKGKYLFKTNSNIDRHQWFTAVELASQGKPPADHLGFLRQNSTHDTYTNEEIITNTLLNEEDETQNKNENDVLEEDELYDDIVYFADPTPSVLINIQQAQNNNTKNNFFANENIDGLKDNPSFEEDEPFDQGRLIERYREIFCNEVNDNTVKEKQRKMAESNENTKLVPSYGYPKSPANYLSTNSHDRITRLTKSADSLRGVPLNSSFDSLERSESSSQQKNKTKNMFSRHLVGSAPEVKALLPRSNLK